MMSGPSKPFDPFGNDSALSSSDLKVCIPFSVL